MSKKRVGLSVWIIIFSLSLLFSGWAHAYAFGLKANDSKAKPVEEVSPATDAADRVEGEIISIDLKTSPLSLDVKTTAGLETIEIDPMASEARWGSQGVSFSELKIGDKVSVEIIDKQGSKVVKKVELLFKAEDMAKKAKANEAGQDKEAEGD